MNIGKAIYGILSGTTAVTDLVSTKIFPEIAEQETAAPFVIYQVQSVQPEDTHDGPSKLDEVRVEVLCYDDSYNGAADLASAVRGALDRVKGTYNGVNVESVQFNDVDFEIEYDPRRYSQVLTFTFRIKRDDIEIALGTPITGAELGDLSDVNVTGVTDNQILSYDAASDTWVPAADAGGAENIDDLDDVNAGSPNNNDVLKFNSSTSKWTPVDWLSVIYAQLKQGTDATITNGSLTDSSLELTSTQAKLKAGITGLDITETSPGTIEIIVATDATGSTEFTALTLEGLTTAEKARFTVNSGTSFYIHGTSAYNNQLRGNSGITSSKVNMLPASDGLLALDADIPSTTDDLTEGSTNIYYTEARVSANTDVAANTAKVGVIAGGTTGQALVKTSGTDYDVEWADIAIDVQYHQRYDTEAGTLRSGGTETIELYYTAQADGDGLSESAQSDTPSAGNVIRRKLWYAEKAQADPDTSGDWTQFADIADDTTFANAKTALLAYLKERTGGTVPISLKMTWEDVTPSSLLLDNYTAAHAYSLRLLRTAYTGDAIEVFNGSSYADIGFDGNGELDTSALATHCGSNDGFVSVWYDQAGSNDITQTTASQRPKIYDGGTGVFTENGKPIIKITTSGTDMNFTTQLGINPAHTFGVSKIDSTDYRPMFGRLNGGGEIFLSRQNDTNSGVVGNGLYINGASSSITTRGEVYSQFVNQTLFASKIPLTGGDRTTLGFNVSSGTNFSMHNMQEVVIFDGAQSDTDRDGIITNINTFYSVY